MNKPNPVPLWDFDANYVNNLGNILESIPRPESFTLMDDGFIVFITNFVFLNTDLYSSFGSKFDSIT